MLPWRHLLPWWGWRICTRRRCLLLLTTSRNTASVRIRLIGVYHALCTACRRCWRHARMMIRSLSIWRRRRWPIALAGGSVWIRILWLVLRLRLRRIARIVTMLLLLLLLLIADPILRLRWRH